MRGPIDTAILLRNRASLNRTLAHPWNGTTSMNVRCSRVHINSCSCMLTDMSLQGLSSAGCDMDTVWPVRCCQHQRHRYRHWQVIHANFASSHSDEVTVSLHLSICCVCTLICRRKARNVAKHQICQVTSSSGP